MIDLRGKRALVTGASRGIGAATARLLARAGANVMIGYRARAADAERVAAELRATGVNAFADGALIPAKHAQPGHDVSPPLAWPWCFAWAGN